MTHVFDFIPIILTFSLREKGLLERLAFMPPQERIYSAAAPFGGSTASTAWVGGA
jgi:hypothetical protein